MIADSYRDFFIAIDGATGALIGLLFVAVSVAPQRLNDSATAHLARTQASAALLAFTSNLSLGLLALLPGNHMGVVTLVIAVLGLTYAGSVSRVAFARAAADKSAYRALLRIAVLAFLPAATQIWASIEMLSAPSDPTGQTILAVSMLSATLFAISRAWELVGMHDIGLLYSLQTLRNPESVANTPDGRVEPRA